MVSRLKSEGYLVTGVDLKYPEFSDSTADEFILGDLRSKEFVDRVIHDPHFAEIYQYAADM